MDWEQVKEAVMLEGLRQKFKQHPNLLKKLLDTKGYRLRETSPYDSYWGTGRNFKGKNRLGFLLEKVREELLKEKDQVKMISVQPDEDSVVLERLK
ncbi:NADAR family protein (plasmid) [Aneurinibacillus sp. Ricciae_BoGa-3]|uniref:NADAR family protein n=1 Tax=Aneurinibacillus sp. Ricciae_BoGa-3 TaxID=3022697 RepID=UPI002341F61E|nr:NADAR family protein [Aneurinibacillus sp. Ricciae_BoGa-3]WCK57014.1 NADAR family protein [Aneurinibacillus sp. Ricciae_BoGa-3]